MNMMQACVVLNIIRKKNRQNPQWINRNLYRQLYMPSRHPQREIRWGEFSRNPQPAANPQRCIVRFPNMDLRIHGCVKAESRVLRNPHARFGGRRLETQVRLCAGRLPYFLLFADNKQTLWKWRASVLQRLERLRL